MFVSGYASGDLTEDDEALMLERALLHAAHAHVDKVVVLNSVESMNYVPVIGRSGEGHRQGPLQGRIVEIVTDRRDMSAFCPYHIT